MNIKPFFKSWNMCLQSFKCSTSHRKKTHDVMAKPGRCWSHGILKGIGSSFGSSKHHSHVEAIINQPWNGKFDAIAAPINLAKLDDSYKLMVENIWEPTHENCKFGDAKLDTPALQYASSSSRVISSGFLLGFSSWIRKTPGKPCGKWYHFEEVNYP